MIDSASPSPFLETERLYLFKLTSEDSPFIYELMNDPDFHLFIGDRGIKTQEDALKHVTEKMIPSYEKNGFGFYAVCRKGLNEPLGIAGLVKRSFLDYVDIGYAFLPAGRGKGFAFESASAVFEFGKDVLKFRRIGAICAPINLRSIKLLERLGLTFEKMMAFPDDDEEVMFFLSE